MALTFRLRKHADYQRVYQSSRKQFSKQMTYFVSAREAKTPDDPATPRVGLTVGKVMGKAVDRNRIKRRMREAVRRNIAMLEGPIDVILHPRRSVIDLDFSLLDREVAQVFKSIQSQSNRKPHRPPKPAEQKLMEQQPSEQTPPSQD